MINHTMTEKEGFFILRIFWGRMLIEEHKIEGTKEEAEQQKSLHLWRLFCLEEEAL